MPSTPFLNSKRILIAGMLSKRSIAYGIAGALRNAGAELAFTYQNERVKDRVRELAAGFSSELLLPCDVSSDAEISNLFIELEKQWDSLDGIIHSVAFAPRESLTGDFLDSVSREAFQVAHDVSSYSFTAMAKMAYPMMAGRNGSLLTLTYLGAVRAMPNYNVMGLAKASLEANVRALAASLGPKGIRVNAISSGPIKTLASSGISGFNDMLDYTERIAPLRRNVTIEEVGNAAAFLTSGMASGITGQVLYVDGGFSISGMFSPVETGGG